MSDREASKVTSELGFTKESRTFLVAWLGQLVSVVGSGMTSFALVVWVFQKTGQVTNVALIALFIVLPGILISPVAGDLIDRLDRRRVMIASDTGAALSTLAVALLLKNGDLAVWHVYVASAVTAICNAFQWPAYSAAITLLVPKRHLGRANGLVQTSQGVGQLVSPLLAGVLVVTVGVFGVVLIDFATFLFAVVTLTIVHFPRPTPSVVGVEARDSFWLRASFGFRYLRARSALLGLLVLMAAANFLESLVVVLGAPLVLTLASPAVWGVVATVAGSGMLAGGLLMSAWGGPRHRIRGILGSQALGALAIVVAGAIESPTVFAAAAFLFFLTLPIIGGSSQAVWQSKVEPDVQGRVFAVRSMIAMSCTPLAYLVAGPLADGVFEPLMAADGALAGTVGRWIGVGPGRGIGLLFIVAGVLDLAVVVIGWLLPRIRHLEREVPDALPDP